MAVQKLREVDVEDAEQLARLGVEPLTSSLYLVRGGVRIAIVSPIGQAASASDEAPPVSRLWELVGAVSSDGPSDVSTNKHKYLADAYADLHESSSDS